MNSARLKEVLASAQTELRDGLAEAEAELAELEGRRAELLSLISQAKAALGLHKTIEDQSPAATRGLTLHEAMAQVLQERDNTWMTARELADEINRRALYTKRDGTPVELNQVHARTKNYSNWFEKNGSRIRRRSS